MFTADHEKITIERHEYRVNAPVVWKDVQDILHQIAKDRERWGGLPYSDDAVQVIPGDDELIFYWEERKS